MSDQNVNPSSGQFIDPLFAIIIGGALNETLIFWVKSSTIPSPLELSIVSLGFINVLLSWYGYHDSVAKKPIRGVLRFSATIILLPLYLLSIVLYNYSMLHIVAIYSVIFFLWGLWEWLRSLEYGTNIKLSKIMLYKWNIIVLVVLMYQIVSISSYSKYIPMALKDNSNWLSICIIILAIIYLRIVKSMNHDGSTVSKFATVINEWLINSDKHKAKNDK